MLLIFSYIYYIYFPRSRASKKNLCKKPDAFRHPTYNICINFLLYRNHHNNHITIRRLIKEGLWVENGWILGGLWVVSQTGKQCIGIYLCKLASNANIYISLQIGTQCKPVQFFIFFHSLCFWKIANPLVRG